MNKDQNRDATRRELFKEIQSMLQRIANKYNQFEERDFILAMGELFKEPNFDPELLKIDYPVNVAGSKVKSNPKGVADKFEHKKLSSLFKGKSPERKAQQKVTLSSLAEELDWALLQVQQGMKTREEVCRDVQAEIVRSLQALEKGEVSAAINQSYPEFNGGTILHLAAALGMDILTRKLIEMGAKANEKDDNDNTPLHSAIIECKKNDEAFSNTISHLVKGGADPEVGNSAGESALDLSKKFKRFLRTNPIKKLLEEGREVYLESPQRLQSLQNSAEEALQELDDFLNHEEKKSESGFGFYNEEDAREELQKLINDMYEGCLIKDDESITDDEFITNRLKEIFKFASDDEKSEMINDNQLILSEKTEGNNLFTGTILHAMIDKKHFVAASELVEVFSPALDVLNGLGQNVNLAAIGANAPKDFLELIAMRGDFGQFNQQDYLQKDAKDAFGRSEKIMIDLQEEGGATESSTDQPEWHTAERRKIFFKRSVVLSDPTSAALQKRNTQHTTTTA